MPLELRELDPEQDFLQVAQCLFESYEDPPQKFFHVLFPIHGEGNDARNDAIKEAAERLYLWHVNDPESYWQVVVDTDNGEIVGGAYWKIHKKNPFAEPQSSEATWFPDDSSRAYANQALAQHTAPRAQHFQMPHLYLFIIFTNPEYRRKGVGKTFMDWGKAKADELALDFCLDSTPYGRPLYEANDFVYVYENVNSPKNEKPDETWKQMEKK
ncbi:hypothetical protein BS50DRAFT_625569 [Corynespora cassiicola Philippines]|uniref:N-acetyltransferase domain-containing protein n=1 Tax=Corynespora cassiicola Philippines TaxID=1448308 RepID=A0A2T2N769_CORCC|nr:hypothetical protein BS50DRAFT_625569 [Corynespora cassiicola Philippines]